MVTTGHRVQRVPFHCCKLGLLCFYVLPQRLDQLLLRIEQVCHLACAERQVADRQVRRRRLFY